MASVATTTTPAPAPAASSNAPQSQSQSQTTHPLKVLARGPFWTRIPALRHATATATAHPQGRLDLSQGTLAAAHLRTETVPGSGNPPIRPPDRLGSTRILLADTQATVQTLSARMDVYAKRAEQALLEVKLAREAMEASGERGVGEVVDVVYKSQAAITKAVQSTDSKLQQLNSTTESLHALHNSQHTLLTTLAASVSALNTSHLSLLAQHAQLATALAPLETLVRAAPPQIEAMHAETRRQVRETFEECMQGALERVLEKIDARTGVSNLSPRTHEEGRLPNNGAGDAEIQNARGQKRKRALLDEEKCTPINDDPLTSASSSLLTQHLQRRRSSVQIQNSTRPSLRSHDPTLRIPPAIADSGDKPPAPRAPSLSLSLSRTQAGTRMNGGDTRRPPPTIPVSVPVPTISNAAPENLNLEPLYKRPRTRAGHGVVAAHIADTTATGEDKYSERVVDGLDREMVTGSATARSIPASVPTEGESMANATEPVIDADMGGGAEKKIENEEEAKTAKNKSKSKAKGKSKAKSAAKTKGGGTATGKRKGKKTPIVTLEGQAGGTAKKNLSGNEKRTPTGVSDASAVTVSATSVEDHGPPNSPSRSPLSEVNVNGDGDRGRISSVNKAVAAAPNVPMRSLIDLDSPGSSQPLTQMRSRDSDVRSAGEAGSLAAALAHIDGDVDFMSGFRVDETKAEPGDLDDEGKLLRVERVGGSNTTARTSATPGGTTTIFNPPSGRPKRYLVVDDDSSGIDLFFDELLDG